MARKGGVANRGQRFNRNGYAMTFRTLCIFSAATVAMMSNASVLIAGEEHVAAPGTAAAAIGCQKDGDLITIQGVAAAQSLELANGSTKSVWILATDRPICIVESENGIDAPKEHRVSRLQVVGKPPPTGVSIELKGKLSTGNITQYYAESTAIVVMSGRRIDVATNQQAPSLTAEPARSAATPLSQAELDAMRARLAKLWDVQPGVEHPEELYVTVRIRLNRDRRLAAPPQVVSSGNSPEYKAAADAAVRAVLKGQPYTMLRDETYEQWKYMDIDFDPKQIFRNENTVRRPQPPPNQLSDAPKVDLAKQRIEGDLKLGYSSISFEDFALDYKSMIRDGKKVAVEGFYHKTGNIDQLYAGQFETLPDVSPPTSHIIPLLVEDAPRDTRAYLLRCAEQSPSVGCWTRVRGTVTMCSLTIFGNSVQKPCISVEGGWFSTN